MNRSDEKTSRRGSAQVVLLLPDFRGQQLVSKGWTKGEGRRKNESPNKVSLFGSEDSETKREERQTRKDKTNEAGSLFHHLNTFAKRERALVGTGSPNAMMGTLERKEGHSVSKLGSLGQDPTRSKLWFSLLPLARLLGLKRMEHVSLNESCVKSKQRLCVEDESKDFFLGSSLSLPAPLDASSTRPPLKPSSRPARFPSQAH